ncbi:MAG: hypothetical protein AB7T06_11910 [Kofleriaceae bacterium]
MRAAVVIIAMSIACGRVGFDARTDGGGAGGGDGSGSSNPDGGGSGDGGSGTCIAATPATTFPGGAPFPCLDWGANANFSNATFTEQNGSLTITPFANTAGASARCSRDNVAIGAAGARVEVSQALAGASSQTRLELDWGGTTYFIGVENNGLAAGRPGVTFTGGVVRRWWRIWPDADELVFDTSDDGQTWMRFGGMGGIPNGTATLRIIAITVNAESAPGLARFESINMCP